MKYYIIAGETSGDLHGANLIDALKKFDTAAEFRIVGGDRMQHASGQTAVIHTSQMAFMGFVEVLANIRTISRNLRIVKADVSAYEPDTLILIDFPGFNLKIAEFAKKNGLRVCYYISPKVWAWNQRRVLKIKQVVDKLFCILPFEVDFYREWGMEVEYVGNPLLDAIAKHAVNPNFLEEHRLTGRPIIALLPGSREMEISRLLPIMANVSRLFPAHHCVIAGAPNFTEEYYKQHLSGLELPIVFDATYDLLKNAEAAVVASGTATLEAALLRVPQVVVYKANPISIAIARMVIKVRFISLVNLITDMLAVRELIQKDCNVDRIADELDLLINNSEYRDNIFENYDLLMEKMGEPGASQRTAKSITTFLHQPTNSL
ncbi:lipid-A-disaccharide synthase [Parapedobacter pyrenivorans]|uniref:Lipid-A-disaccharide synthase n=1 Tax=Parapedobacter pyrenivorans TaxID=1305674 RepID=A0A917MDE4_9SPHI|nr:lipid-A-disaccharide synthase [Parapedobacter pyrenivorans]GGG94987.1 lipid-A-disaccharide synthase [Parapedobacter pyrenivorans]